MIDFPETTIAIERPLTCDEVCRLFGFTRPTLSRALKEGRFPAPLRNTGYRRKLLWDVETIREWAEARRCAGKKR